MVRIGVVCGGGGDIAAAFMCGCVTAIYEATGWNPGEADFIVGTSAGSIIGSALRQDLDPTDYHATMVGDRVSRKAAKVLTPEVLGGEDDGLPPLADDALSHARLTAPDLIARSALMPGRVKPVVLAAAALPEGRLDNSFVRNKILALRGDDWPADPLLITATRMDNGHRVVLSAHSQVRAGLSTAVAASCAIPSVFKPVMIEGAKYVDGGIRSGTNADVLLRQELDVVLILSPLSSESKLSSALVGPVRTAMRMAAVAEQQKLRGAGAEVLTFHPNMRTINAMGLNIMDVKKRPRISTLARESAAALLASPKADNILPLLREAAQSH